MYFCKTTKQHTYSIVLLKRVNGAIIHNFNKINQHENSSTWNIPWFQTYVRFCVRIRICMFIFKWVCMYLCILYSIYTGYTHTYWKSGIFYIYIKLFARYAFISQYKISINVKYSTFSVCFCICIWYVKICTFILKENDNFDIIFFYIDIIRFPL